MSRFRFLASVALATLLSTASGCASTSSNSGLSGYFDDALITAKIRTALVDDDLLTSYKINVETVNGVVRLSGSVRDESEITRALTDAGKVSGVKSVTNALQIN
jgi:osmotically-inducible protein OsmY